MDIIKTNNRLPEDIDRHVATEHLSSEHLKLLEELDKEGLAPEERKRRAQAIVNQCSDPACPIEINLGFPPHLPPADN